MRTLRKLALLCTLFVASGCHRAYVVPETPMPPNTILLSQSLRQLSARPGFTDTLLSEIDKGGKMGPALLTPALFNELRKLILGSDWQGLDRFPGWTMRAINPTVHAVGHIVGKDQKLEDAAAAHPGAPLSQAQTREYLDLGPYALNKAETLSLDEPSTLPPFSTQGIVTDLGDGVVRGDGPNDLAPEHAESQRLADALNRLAANKLDGAQPFTVTTSGHSATTPEQLIAALAATGNTITVDDARYFANFAHLHYNGMDVMAPFWIDSQLIVPHSGGRHLLVPAAHAEYEWHIRSSNSSGPLINADISYYFGIDGKAEWRTMDTLDQPWVLKRNAHEYSGAQAIEVTRLAGLMTVAYAHLHAAHPSLPFGEYYALGVCQDGVSAIEYALTGHVTLFPNTADDAYFNDPRDAEINALIAAIPKDRDGKPPDPARIFGSLPTAPAANVHAAFNAVTIPGLATDLNATYAAWQQGNLTRNQSIVFYIALAVGLLVALLLLLRRPHTGMQD
jgi:Flp pilus assembly pilin Flp